jgi:hypothetical protein
MLHCFIRLQCELFKETAKYLAQRSPAATVNLL